MFPSCLYCTGQCRSGPWKQLPECLTATHCDAGAPLTLHIKTIKMLIWNYSFISFPGKNTTGVWTRLHRLQLCVLPVLVTEDIPVMWQHTIGVHAYYLNLCSLNQFHTWNQQTIWSIFTNGAQVVCQEDKESHILWGSVKIADTSWSVWDVFSYMCDHICLWVSLLWEIGNNLDDQ